MPFDKLAGVESTETTDRARLGIHLIVDKVELAEMREAIFAGKAEIDRRIVAELAFMLKIDIFQIDAFIDIDAESYRLKEAKELSAARTKQRRSKKH